MCKKCGCDDMVTVQVDVSDDIIKILKRKYNLKTKREVILFINGYIVGYYTSDTQARKYE